MRLSLVIGKKMPKMSGKKNPFFQIKNTIEPSPRPKHMA
jgi:hypothetical protein